MPVGCPLSDEEEYSGISSMLRYIKALSGVSVGCSCSVGLIVAACFDVPIPILPECLVCRPECPTMHGIALRHIITPLTQNTLKIALFRECLNGISNKDRHRQQLLTFLPCSDTSRLFRVSLLGVPALSV